MRGVGVDKSGRRVVLDVVAPWHFAVQGATRSGKSVFLYVLLGMLARRLDVMVCGCDPSGVLLAPWGSHSGESFRALGTGDLLRHVQVSRALVSVMDERIGALIDPARGVFRDKLTEFDETTPLLVAVFEEFPGLVSALETEDKSRKPADRLAPVFRANVRRLIQEGAKVGVRVVLVAQRFDASIIGGAERSNLATRVTFRVDNADAVRMLHPDVSAELVGRIKNFRPGVGLLECPGEESRVFRGDVATYEEYAAHVWKAGAARGARVARVAGCA